MFNKNQLEFIKASLTAQNAAVPCGDGGKAARLFISVLDVIDEELQAIAAGNTDTPLSSKTD